MATLPGGDGSWMGDYATMGVATEDYLLLVGGWDKAKSPPPH